jgi:hypothetical protein
MIKFVAVAEEDELGGREEYWVVRDLVAVHKGHPERKYPKTVDPAVVPSLVEMQRHMLEPLQIFSILSDQGIILTQELVFSASLCVYQFCCLHRSRMR